MDDIRPATKKLTTRAAVEDYVAGFNADDFARFSGYYAKDAIVSTCDTVTHVQKPSSFVLSLTLAAFLSQLNIPALEDKSLTGYIAWLKAMHTMVSEELIPQDIIMEPSGRQVHVNYHVQFRGLGDFRTENFNGRLGPVSRGTGPLVRMSLTYQLNCDGHITGIEVSNFALLEQV
ncbi:hypothetical protein CNYM01_03228 [Colletotrichum nymphaeae SA-01]|uniref:SnoaL-like domain-containing protein n=1 Tax=Colletotrichum nymphaeae SA-01 TaxID=1460502 RepID=A0A135T561_9PEZI|nr:hypothetical protein CNYM01_03228 [Colletotrichum nymphaeae SA-01]